jgi:pimeloyl-ACP methyl ester carboxylesterase
MMSFRTARTELTALVTTVLATPFGGFVCPDMREAAGRNSVPVVFVHGLLGGRANFRTLRTHLIQRGARDLTTFSYGLRVDYQRLALRLGEHIAAVQRETGAEQVDIVGHSLGGLVARYLIEMGDGRYVRRLVTLASPYFGERFPSRELAIFASNDLLVPPPILRRPGCARVVVVPECGHLGILSHPAALGCVADYLHRSLRRIPLGRSPLAHAAA